MGRRQGARNRDYDETRTALARTLSRAMLRDDGSPATLADLAAAGGVSTTTLRHYFGDRDGAVAAALDVARQDSATYLADAAEPAGRPPERTLEGLLLGAVLAWRAYGLDRVMTGGLAVGLGHEDLGRRFLTDLLEPFLVAAERLLEAHGATGDLPVLGAEQRRRVALSLLSPVLLGLLHQHALGGHAIRPLDLNTFARDHADLMLTGIRSRATGGRSCDPAPGRG